MKKSCFLFVATCFFAFIGSAQVIHTVAGTGKDGYDGDQKRAIQAELNAPNDVAIDKYGNLYIADWYNACIRKVYTSGTIYTIAGTGKTGYSGDGGPATAATLNYPNRVAVDTLGNVYIADVYNNCVRIVDTGGIMHTFAGNGASGYSGDNDWAHHAALSYPSGLACDKKGNVFIADRLNHCIRMVDASGFIFTIAGTGEAGFSGDNGPATAALLNNPNGLSVDDSGNIYFSGIDNRIRKINSAGIISTIAGNGIAGHTGDGGMATAGELNNPSGLATDTAGNVFVADLDNSCIRLITKTGIMNTYAGNCKEGFSGDGGSAIAAQLNGPNGVALDKWGHLYIADNINNRVRRVIPPASRPIAKKPEPLTKNYNCGRFTIAVESNNQVITPTYGATPGFGSTGNSTESSFSLPSFESKSVNNTSVKSHPTPQKHNAN